MNVPRDVRLQTLAGQIYPAEGRELRRLAAAVPAHLAIVELGAGRGKSTCYLSVGSGEGSRARILSIDRWGDHPDPYWARRGVLAQRMHELQVRLEGDPSLVRPLRQPSDVPVAVRVGLLFVDGDHRPDQVRLDLEAWLPFLDPGATVALHDWAGDFPGVELVGRALLGEPTRVVETMAIFER